MKQPLSLAEPFAGTPDDVERPARRDEARLVPVVPSNPDHRAGNVGHGYDAAARMGASGTRSIDLIFNPMHWPAWEQRLDDFATRRHTPTPRVVVQEPNRSL